MTVHVCACMCEHVQACAGVCGRVHGQASLRRAPPTEDTALCLHLLLTSFGSCLSDACSEQRLPRSPGLGVDLRSALCQPRDPGQLCDLLGPLRPHR